VNIERNVDLDSLDLLAGEAVTVKRTPIELNISVPLVSFTSSSSISAWGSVAIASSPFYAGQGSSKQVRWGQNKLSTSPPTVGLVNYAMPIKVIPPRIPELIHRLRCAFLEVPQP
jgi:hypothetical protein